MYHNCFIIQQSSSISFIAPLPIIDLTCKGIFMDASIKKDYKEGHTLCEKLYFLPVVRLIFFDPGG